MINAKRLAFSISVFFLAFSFVACARDKKIKLSSKSSVAIESFSKAVKFVEMMDNQQAGSEAQKSVDADSNFAMGYVLLSAVGQPAEKRAAFMDRAVSLSSAASRGERQYIEASQLSRQNRTAEAIEKFEALAADYPAERMVHMMLGQLYLSQGEYAKAEAALGRAAAIDGSTARVHTLLGQCAMMQEKYAEARQHYEQARTLAGEEATPFLPFFGLAWTYLYESQPDSALKVIDEYLARYNRNGAAQGFPAVWIWNQKARINLEYGRPEIALQAYETGYKTVPPSRLDSTQKQIWYGRKLHGTARSLAKMGRFDQALKIVGGIKKMIDDSGEQGQQFLPSYHYVAGYVLLEKGDLKAAIEHLEQANSNDPFHVLLLARAYERAGDVEKARAAYGRVVESRRNSVERALSYAEAKRKLAALSSN